MCHRCSKAICINVCRVLIVNCAGRDGTIYNLIEELVFAVAFDPLLKVASLTVLHYNEHETLVWEDYRVIDFHDMFVLQPSLDLYLVKKIYQTSHICAWWSEGCASPG